jgi:hypothetical protein
MFFTTEKLMAFPTANRNEGKTRSVGVKPCHEACRRGLNGIALLPGVFTIIMKQMVRPLNTSNGKNLGEAVNFILK